MNISYLENQVMSMIPSLRDPTEIHFALNRVIDKINSSIYGIRDNLMAFSLPGHISSGFVWNSSLMLLTLPKTLKRVLQVFMKVGTKKYFYDNKNSEYVENNPSKDIYWQPSRDQLEFAKENTNLQGSSGILYIVCIRTFTRVTSSASEVDFPESWAEGVISGIISILTLKGKYKDEALYKESKTDFRLLLEGIDKWESSRVPISEGKQGYNYAEPGKY